MSAESEPARRATHIPHEAVYAAVGASAAADLLRFPPAGSSPFAHEVKLGSGADRFLTATNTLMTWGAQRAVGIAVDLVNLGDEDRYLGVSFTADGTPEPAPQFEVRYGPDGEPFLAAGMSVTLHWPNQKLSRQVRVVYVIDETRRAGFALGTADEAGVIGETAYSVEHRADDTVWAITRGFYWAPSSGLFGLKAKAMIRLAEKSALKQIGALAPGIALANGAEAEQSEADQTAPGNIEEAALAGNPVVVAQPQPAPFESPTVHVSDCDAESAGAVEPDGESD